MTSIIQELCNTFDVNVLQSLPSDELKSIVDYAKSNISKGNNKRIVNTLLAMIINRYAFTHIKHRRVDIVEGPITLSEHRLDDIHIYIFGDWHYFYNMCEKKYPKLHTVGIDEFIHDQVVKSYKFIDVFLEVRYQIEQNDRLVNVSSYLSRTGAMFPGCLTKVKDCSVYNARIHYADIRFNLDKIFEDYTYKFSYVSIILSYIIYGGYEAYIKGILRRENINNEMVMDKLIEIMKEILDMDIVKKYRTYKDVWLHLSKDFMNRLKITKQLKNVEDHRIRDEIVNMMDDCLKEQPHYDIVTNFERILKNIRTKKRKFADISTLIYLGNTTLNIAICYMDGYLLGRMFRSYTNKRGEYSKSAKNIIIYVGDTHANNYRRILAKIGFKTIHDIKADFDTQCVNISKVKQPFFSD